MTKKGYTIDEWIKESVDKLANKIDDILVNTGQHDTEKFHLGDTIRYTPTEVQKIIKDNWREFLVDNTNVTNVTTEQLPRTRTYLASMERIFQHLQVDYEFYDNCTTEEKFIIDNPMMTLAGVLYSESPEWAAELAKHICVLDGINIIDTELYKNIGVK